MAKAHNPLLRSDQLPVDESASRRETKQVPAGNLCSAGRRSAKNQGTIVMARNFLRISGFFLTFASIALFLGCQPSHKIDKPKSSNSETGNKSVTQAAEGKADTALVKSDEKDNPGIIKKDEKSVSKRSKSKTPPPPLAIPKVGLTDTLRATCLVNEGDIFPDGEVRQSDGSKVSLQSQYGEKFTVVYLWSEGGSNYARLTADASLQDLQSDIVNPYAGKGIKVFGINVGDNPQSVRQQLEKNGVKLSCYFDADKTFFSKVAKSKLPRVYLLDASGKIIWFDTEFSQASRRNLMQAIQVVIGEK
jgi:hypothetical protein